MTNYVIIEMLGCYKKGLYLSRGTTPQIKPVLLIIPTHRRDIFISLFMPIKKWYLVCGNVLMAKYKAIQIDDFFLLNDSRIEHITIIFVF